MKRRYCHFIFYCACEFSLFGAAILLEYQAERSSSNGSVLQMEARKSGGNIFLFFWPRGVGEPNLASRAIKKAQSYKCEMPIIYQPGRHVSGIMAAY